jgi:hypothetical protein
MCDRCDEIRERGFHITPLRGFVTEGGRYLKSHSTGFREETPRRQASGNV